MAVVALGCSGGGPSVVPSTAATGPGWLVDRLGGATAAKALRGRPFNQAARDLGLDEIRSFAAGADVFDAHMTVANGLGPDFNEDSCLSCHLDRPGPGGLSSTPEGLLVRVSKDGAPVAGLGLQLQTRSTTGHPEATVEPRWVTTTVRLPDGTVYSLRRPATKITTRVPLPEGTATSSRMAPPLIGLGLLEAIPAASLEAAADPGDRDHDGISGRVNVVSDPAVPGGTTIGRFGWKAGQASVASQTDAALTEDMGIRPAPTADGQPAEISPEDLANLILYSRTIAVPISNLEHSPAARRGAALFEQVGCAACHTPTQRSGPDPVPGLADQTFHPFTDLLLHDMGPGLADGRRDGSATGSEWRTAPLWGLGRRVAVTGRRAFLHDGRARTPVEAILWHGGEAAAARERFEHLSAQDRAALEAFLDGL
jgi:CxxC motif-containing protein (DUF1111 family)